MDANKLIELTKQAEIGNGCVVDHETRRMHPQMNVVDLLKDYSSIVAQSKIQRGETDGNGVPIAQLDVSLVIDSRTNQTTVALVDKPDVRNPKTDLTLASVTVDNDTQKIVTSSCQPFGPLPNPEH